MAKITDMTIRKLSSKDKAYDNLWAIIFILQLSQMAEKYSRLDIQ